MRRLLLALLPLCVPASAAITFETPDCLTASPSSTTATLTGANLRAGSNRIITVQVRVQTVSTWSSVSATLGGVAMTAGPVATGDTASAYSFYIPEAALSALPVDTYDVVLTGSGGDVGTIHGTVTQLNDAAQQAPEQTGTHNASVEAAPIALTSLTIGAGVVYDVRTASDRTSTIAVGGGLTESCPSEATFGSRGISGRLIADATSETPTSTWTDATTARGTALAFAPAATVTAAPFWAVIGGDAGWPGLYAIQSLSYPDAEEEAAYTLSPTPVAVNGQTDYAWSTVGALPSGLSISSSTGVITGTPAAASAGTYPFTLKATDAGGGFAFRNTSITVQDSGSGSLSWVVETAEGGSFLNTWATAGGCSATSRGVLEDSNEVSMTSGIPCVLVTGLNLPEIYIGWDEYRDTCPATDIDPAIEVRDIGDNILASVRIENDCDMFVWTPGITDWSGRGHRIAWSFSSDPDRDRRVDFHLATGTGGNAVLRARTDNGTISEFSLGTITTNIHEIAFVAGNDGAGDWVRDRITIDDAEWAGLGAISVPEEPPPADQPWIYSFAPERIHYVDDGACGGDGTIGDPDCWEDALDEDHYQCGDEHRFRADTYREGDTTILRLDKNCTQEAPAVFRGYVDPATGQPERAKFVSHFELNGNWTWLVGLEFTDEVSTSNKNMVELQCDGCMIINNVMYENRYTDNINVWAFAQNVIYGNVSYRPSPLDTTNPRGHHLYTQNDFAADGWKYILQNFFMEQAVTGSHSTNLNTSGGFIDGFHLQDNLYAEANGWLGVNHAGSTGTASRIKLHRNYHFNTCSGSGRHLQVNPQPTQFEITDSYFARSGISIEGYWGTTRPSTPGNVFTGNEVYDPCLDDHIKIVKVGNTKSVDGVSKLHDGDVWDDNTYGGTFRAESLQCNSGSSSNLTLAQWRTATDNCRVTPDAGDANGFDLGSTVVANPTVNKIVVLKNEWQCSACTFNDMNRGNIYIANWENAASDIVDISSVVGPSKGYTVRYARAFFDTAAASGTCPSSGACNVTLNVRRSHGETATLFTGAYVITGQP